MDLTKEQIDEYMVLAYKKALASPDPSTQNGAVVLDRHGVIAGRGCNRFAPGIAERHWRGPKEDKYARVAHAEVAAILNAAAEGHPVTMGTLICPWAACSNCAKYIAYAGIDTLIRHKFSNSGGTTGSHWYADCLIGDEIMTEAGMTIIEIEPVVWDGTLRRDGKPWSSLDYDADSSSSLLT